MANHRICPGTIRETVTHYRVWIAECGGWQPKDAHDWPPEAIAVEPAERGVLSARQARRYVEAFNRTAAAQKLAHWAVALPVVIRYEGDLQAGQRLGALGSRPPLARMKDGR